MSQRLFANRANRPISKVFRIPETDGLYPLPPKSRTQWEWSAVIIHGSRRFYITPHSKVCFQGDQFATPDGLGISISRRPPGLQSRDKATAEPTTKLQTIALPISRLLRSDGRSVVLQHGITTIGRQYWCDLSIKDPAVSSVHCIILRDSNASYLIDAQSSNGSLINGHLATKVQIHPGDTIQLGDTLIQALEERPLKEGRGSPKGLAHLSSPAMQEVDRVISKIAPTLAPVLIYGETGVGKESVATSIHRRSERIGNFVAINAATLRPGLAASTLFGHRKGAFTGASHHSKGAFLEATEGTLFLDEVAELAIEVQTALLRVIETGRVRAVGTTHEISVNVRIVTATHSDLPYEVQRGTFREDLFHRLCVLPIVVAPLRSRREDIAVLTNHFLRSQRPPRILSSQAKRKLMTHPWPGNIRELINTLTRACVVSQSPTLPATAIEFLPFVAPALVQKSPDDRTTRPR